MRPLLPTVSRYDSLTPVGEPMPTSASPRWVNTPDGREWLLKRMEDSGPEEIIAEGFAWLFGQTLGALIPPCALWRDGTQIGWLSERVKDVEHWGAGLHQRINNPRQVAAMLVLDALLGNRDRHAANLLVDWSLDQTSARLWAIDHGSAGIADVHMFQQLGWAAPRPHRDSPHLPYRLLAPLAHDVAVDAEALNAAQLRGQAEFAWSMVEQMPPTEIINLLVERCQRATKIVAEYLSFFGDTP